MKKIAVDATAVN